jgi:hypothetical protein
MQFWNTMLEKAHGAIRLVFEKKQVTIADKKGTEYSIDMAAAVGAPALPELRQSMEKLFGPGGAFRLQFVNVDEHTVLLAAATTTQAAEAIKVLQRRTAPSTDPPELRDTAELLSKQAAWRLFVSPSGYNDWLRRQMDAVLGQVIGGPVVREFRASPPLGAAGGVDGSLVWTEIAVPIETIRSIGQYVGN